MSGPPQGEQPEQAQRVADDAPGQGPVAASRLRSAKSWSPSRAAALALLLGAIVTAGFALTTLALYRSSENRLLDLRAREVGSVLTAVVPSIQTPLASAAELADATRGDKQKFRAFMAPYVGAGKQFVSASLWPLGQTRARPSTIMGARPVLTTHPQRAAALFARAGSSTSMGVIGVLDGPDPSLGFEFATPGVKHGFAVYAESPLPKDRRSKLAGNSAFSDLDYVLYLGHSQNTAKLLLTSVKLPVEGRRASQTVPFGDSAFTLVVTPRGPLDGSFFADLPWLVAIIGALVSLAAALMTGRLARRRQHAERLTVILDRTAAENHRLYTEQRSIAQTLQHALLPDEVPDTNALQVRASYVPASSGIDVGGDWYDFVNVDDDRMLLLVGDVSGHGLPAATTMAALRHAALAYAAEEPRPARVLERLQAFVNREPHRYFATVLCALIDAGAHELTIASAGHMAPLLAVDGEASFVEIDAGVPIGVAGGASYAERKIQVSPHSTLIAFTDGLVERRKEVLDVGLGRLRDAVEGTRLPLGDLLSKLVGELYTQDHHDDTAIVGIRWRD
ncbi:MAG TPA: PP2C family protein-serine/threonine phosphatase [Solirubrobacteraceae bacterium]|jgi:serine phosphatase RsbU (regulator of sigma subunit)